jgi:hypothetical protein
LGISTNLRRGTLVFFANARIASLKNKQKFELARPVH